MLYRWYIVISWRYHKNRLLQRFWRLLDFGKGISTKLIWKFVIFFLLTVDSRTRMVNRNELRLEWHGNCLDKVVVGFRVLFDLRFMMTSYVFLNTLLFSKVIYFNSRVHVWKINAFDVRYFLLSFRHDIKCSCENRCLLIWCRLALDCILIVLSGCKL